jgi:hypothetical protein
MAGHQAAVIILDEPTKGIDIGSKAACTPSWRNWPPQGLAVIMVSSEIPEVVGMSDRVIVMREGRIVAEVDAPEVTPEVLVRHAAGITGSPPQHGGVNLPRFIPLREALLGALAPAAWADLQRFPAFVAPANLINVFNDTSPLIILALGQMIVILTRCIDLSVAANLALTGMVVALINVAMPGLPMPVICVIAILLGRCWGRSTACWSGSWRSRPSWSRSAP